MGGLRPTLVRWPDPLATEDKFTSMSEPDQASWLGNLIRPPPPFCLTQKVSKSK